MPGFISTLTPVLIQEQISEDWGCIYKQVLGDREWDHIKAHIGRLAGTKLIGANLDIDCEEDQAFGSSGPQQIIKECEECAKLLGVELPVQGGEPSGSFATKLMMRVILKILAETDWDDAIENLIYNWVN